MQSFFSVVLNLWYLTIAFMPWRGMSKAWSKRKKLLFNHPHPSSKRDLCKRFCSRPIHGALLKAPDKSGNYTFPRKIFFPRFILILFITSCTAPVIKEGSFPFPDTLDSADSWSTGSDPWNILPLFVIHDDWLKESGTNHNSPKGWLGISFNKSPADALAPDSEQKLKAIKILRVFPESPADKAGIKLNDLIIAVDGERFDTDSWDAVFSNFVENIGQRGPKGSIALELLRENLRVNVTAQLISRPSATVHLPSDSKRKQARKNARASLVQHVLENGGLKENFIATLQAIRDKAELAVSPAVKREGYNPFRLTAVNRALFYPMEVPLIAQEIVAEAAQPLAQQTPDLAGLISAGMKALDISTTDTAQATANNLSGFLGQFVGAVGQARLLRREAFAALTASEMDDLYATGAEILSGDPATELEEPSAEEKKLSDEKYLRFLNAVLKVDLEKLLSAGKIIAGALDLTVLSKLNFGNSIDIENHPEWSIEKSHDTVILKTPEGEILIGGTGANVYEKDFLLIIDLGGDDIYLNHAGASSRERPFSVVIDLRGNDRYESAEDFSQGAGFLGAGFLIDLAGDDRYEALDYSQGAGILGVGLLADLAGNDVYKGVAVTQGAGAWGIGLLVESDGMDDYSSARFAQGFGFVKGYGALLDSAGDDRYYAGGLFPDHRDPDHSFQSLSQGFGFGMRPIDSASAGASGGIGLLLDADGDDTYVADYFGQGASYWYALGILADQKGNDNYSAGRYAQGAGIHISAGVLFDRQGNDRYRAGFGVAQGLGHDLAVGFLLDGAGDDEYRCGVMCQGAGNANGIGVLNDQSGQDGYWVDGLGQGRGNYVPSRQLGSFGFLVDTGGGADSYSTHSPNQSLTYRPDWGILADF